LGREGGRGGGGAHQELGHVDGAEAGVRLAAGA